MELIKVESTLEACNLDRVRETRAMVPGGVKCRCEIKQVGTPEYHPEIVNEKGGTVEHWCHWTCPRRNEEVSALIYTVSRGRGICLPPLPEHAVDMFPAYHDTERDLWYAAASV